MRNYEKLASLTASTPSLTRLAACDYAARGNNDNPCKSRMKRTCHASNALD